MLAWAGLVRSPQMRTTVSCTLSPHCVPGSLGLLLGGEGRQQAVASVPAAASPLGELPPSASEREEKGPGKAVCAASSPSAVKLTFTRRASSWKSSMPLLKHSTWWETLALSHWKRPDVFNLNGNNCSCQQHCCFPPKPNIHNWPHLSKYVSYCLKVHVRYLTFF